MAELFASGHIVDFILILVACEALVLLGWRRTRGHGPAKAALIANLSSGAALMLAVRAALTSAHWTAVAGFLLVAFVAHLTEMWLRFRHAPVGSLRRTCPPRAAGTSA